MPPGEENDLKSLLNEVAVIDVTDNIVYIGTLVEVNESYYVLQDADVHFMGESASSKEKYVMEARTLGHRTNRRLAYVRKEKVTSLSLLDDVI